jgi:putative sporulation protein YyaC
LSSKTKLISKNYQPQRKIKTNRVHIDDRLAISTLKQIISYQLSTLYSATQTLIIFCIGTDRSTGDALGPLVGSKLNKFNLDDRIKVYGTLENPIHATNMEENIATINSKYKEPLIIAIDAGLGKSKSVGSIEVNSGPLQPGSGVNKSLPEVGDLHITGLVNIGGYMEYFVLQSTRLSLVVKMAKIIAYSLFNSFHSNS